MGNNKQLELAVLLQQKLKLYGSLKRFFYISFAVCLVLFVVGIFLGSVMAVATGFVAGMMLAMAYLGIVMTLDDEIQTLRTRMAQAPKD